jgi:hypothetical protein
MNRCRHPWSMVSKNSSIGESHAPVRDRYTNLQGPVRLRPRENRAP